MAVDVFVFWLSIDYWLLNLSTLIPLIIQRINSLFLERMVLEVLELLIVIKCRAE